MRRSSIALLLLIGSLLLAACSEREPVEGLAASEFDLAVGESALVADGQLRVTFMQVSADSRCPAQVQCIWAGSATVELSLESAGDQGGLSLSTVPMSSTGIFKAFRLTLIHLTPDPPPVPGSPVPPSQYHARLQVGSALD